MKFPKLLFGLPAMVVHIFAIPGFLLLSILLYAPEKLVDLLHAGQGLSSISNIYPFNIAIVCTIVLGVMLIMRTVFYFLRRFMKMTIAYYCVWCIGETAVAAAFVAMFLTLISHNQENYFVFLSRTFGVFDTILIYPYLLLGQFFCILELSSGISIDEEKRLKFYDNRKLLKFTTNVDSILYIKADENYLSIYYIENNAVKKYELRNSMKSIEGMCLNAGFVRTHRSYILNPTKLASVGKIEEGRYVANLNAPGVPEIPVSKRYYPDIADIL